MISRAKEDWAWIIFRNAYRRWRVPWSGVHDLDDLRVLLDLFAVKMLFSGYDRLILCRFVFPLSFFPLFFRLPLLHVVFRVVAHRAVSFVRSSSFRDCARAPRVLLRIIRELYFY